MGRKQDFSNSIIYHIRHMESKEVIYVGSTTNFFIRKAKHKYLWNKEGNHFIFPIYCHIRNNGGFDCFEVIPIQSLKLENKTELLIAEQVEIDRHRTLVNRNKAHTTIEEKRIDHNERTKKYNQDHKEDIKQYNKQYKEEHKAELNENSKKYRQEHKEDLKEYHKQYHEEHKVELNENSKKWREEQYYQEKIECDFCSKRLSKCSLYRHLKICKSKPVKND